MSFSKRFTSICTITLWSRMVSDDYGKSSSNRTHVSFFILSISTFLLLILIISQNAFSMLYLCSAFPKNTCISPHLRVYNKRLTTKDQHSGLRRTCINIQYYGYIPLCLGMRWMKHNTYLCIIVLRMNLNSLSLC